MKAMMLSDCPATDIGDFMAIAASEAAEKIMSRYPMSMPVTK